MVHGYALLIVLPVLAALLAALYAAATRPRPRVAGRRPVAPPPPPAPPRCPVSPAQRAWIEQSMRWCVVNFGEEAARRPVAEPTPEFLLAPYTATAYQVGTLFASVCALMGVRARDVDFRLLDRVTAASRPEAVGRRTVGCYRRRDVHLRGSGRRLFWLGRGRIEVDRAEAVDPARLVAILAHELGHERLIGEGRVTWAQPDQERLTDLLTVYLGLGVFSANAAWAASRSRLGYLSAPEYGFILACHARLRGEGAQAAWARQLTPFVRKYFDQSLAFLDAEGRGSGG